MHATSLSLISDYLFLDITYFFAVTSTFLALNSFIQVINDTYCTVYVSPT